MTYYETIQRNAVGRIARIGDLYDARTDTFVGLSTFSRPLDDDDIDVIKMPKSDVNYIHAENILEKFEKLDIVPELRASILANLVSLDGHGKYLEIEPRNKKIRKSMFCSIQTQVDKLILTDELPFALDSLDLDFATHFVVGIEWGANTIITLQETEYGNESESAKTAKNMQEKLEKFAKCIDGSQDSILDTSNDNYAIEMFSDILRSAINLPKNVREATKMLGKISRLVHSANQGKGKQIMYFLMSISDLDDYLNGTETNNKIQSLAEDAIQNVANLIGEIMEAKREISDVVFRFETHSDYIPVESMRKLAELKSETETHEMQLRNEFKDAIIAIRSGTGDSDSLDQIYAKGGCEFITDEFRVRLKAFDNMLMKIEVIDKLKTYKIDCIGSNRSIEFDKIKCLADKVYILYLRAEAEDLNSELWSQNKLYFVNLFDQSRSGNANKFAFVAIDLDVRQDLKINDKEEGAQICSIDGGSIVDGDVYGTFLRHQKTCYARIYVPFEKHPKPSRRIELQLKCPGSFKSMCGNTTHKWHCFSCKEALSYGFDGFFYCSCGRAKSKKFSFKCIDTRHTKFALFDEKQLDKLLSEIPSLNELNVLILGVTGVGKSTWINAFLNYLAFPSLDEASQSELLSVTSSAFQLTDENDVTHTIRFGQDENEVLEPGQSATQDVKAHLFPVGNTLLRLIDTPGIGDVRGVEQDKKNFDKILKYLSTLKYLNGICILLKPNESRLNVLFEFCVKELLTHLHKNASKNVVFCFTHSRETFYKPGDTRQPLGELLKKNQIYLNLNKDTMYCMDNESFRFLCAANQGIQFRESVVKSFSESWTISVEETNRLISYFKTMKPHVIDDTISLNDARKNIVCLTKPIADISKNIQQNLAIIKDKRDTLTSSNASKRDLMKMLYLDTITLETEPLNHPRTVCGAPSCVEYHPTADGSIESIEYVQHCHPHCYLTGVAVNIVGDSRLQQCAAMNGTLNCIQCGCSWDQHLHITYVQNRVIVRITVKDVQSKITGKESEQEQIEAFIQTIEDIRLEQEDEQRKIIEVSVKLGRYLSKNAILPYNDVLGRYVDHLIDKEEQKVSGGGSDDMLKRLRTMKEMYEEEEKALVAAMAQPDAEELTFHEFHEQLDQLYRMKINGAQLQNAIEQASLSSDGEKKSKDYEKFHGAKCKSRGHGLHTTGKFQACVQSGYSGETKKTDEGYFTRTVRWVTTKFWRY